MCFTIESRSYGDLIHFQSHQDRYIFFGNKNSKIEILQQQFPHLTFIQLNQIHGTTLVQSTIPDAPSASASWQDADTHWTQQNRLALSIRTADCLPILVSTPHRIVALHAGWRGLAQGIIPKTINSLFPFLENNKNLIKHFFVFFGPCIQKTSYQVGAEVVKALSETVRQIPENSISEFPIVEILRRSPPADVLSPKYYISLSHFAAHQLIELAVPRENIYIHPGDTFVENKFHSYRRDQINAGRQISFIALDQ